MHLISTGKKNKSFGLDSKNAESTRRKVVVTFYSIVLWINTHRGHKRPGEHELQLLHPSRVPREEKRRRARPAGGKCVSTSFSCLSPRPRQKGCTAPGDRGEQFRVESGTGKHPYFTKNIWNWSFPRSLPLDVLQLL